MKSDRQNPKAPLPRRARSAHCLVRCSERGIPDSQLGFVLRFGQRFRGANNRIFYYFNGKALEAARTVLGARLEALLNTVLVFTTRGICVTTFKRSSPQSHWVAA
ncbi:MAG: hypothetical protein IPP14_15505 [Planctomycetes bacterium]|nr:hypothetical protein [Planctomycetota bacterium]